MLTPRTFHTQKNGWLVSSRFPSSKILRRAIHALFSCLWCRHLRPGTFPCRFSCSCPVQYFLSPPPPSHPHMPLLFLRWAYFRYSRFGKFTCPFSLFMRCAYLFFVLSLPTPWLFSSRRVFFLGVHALIRYTCTPFSLLAGTFGLREKLRGDFKVRREGEGAVTNELALMLWPTQPHCSIFFVHSLRILTGTFIIVSSWALRPVGSRMTGAMMYPDQKKRVLLQNCWQMWKESSQRTRSDEKKSFYWDVTRLGNATYDCVRKREDGWKYSHWPPIWSSRIAYASLMVSVVLLGHYRYFFAFFDWFFFYITNQIVK